MVFKKKTSQTIDEQFIKNLKRNTPDFAHAERIIELRKLENLSQEQLAEIVGLSSKTIGKIERGEQKMSPDNAIVIFKKWGYSLDWLYGVCDSTSNIQNNFMVDLREIVKMKKTLLADGREQKVIALSLANNYLNYLEDIDNLHDIEKKNDISLDSISLLGRKFRYSHKSLYKYTEIPLTEFHEIGSICSENTSWYIQ